MKKVLLSFVLIATAISVLFGLYNQWNIEAVRLDDIHLEATLKQNDNWNMANKDYMLEIVISKDQVSQNTIYPYINGLVGMSFDHGEETGYFVAGSIGEFGGDRQPVIQALQKHHITHGEYDYMDPIFLGFSVPPAIGMNKVRVYYDATSDFALTDKMVIVYVHKGKKRFGLEDKWTKTFEVKVEVK